MTMETRILKSWEVSAINRNLAHYDSLFKVCVRKCGHCSYPLSALVEHFFSTEANGKVCDLCHTLEDAARQQPGLREAQMEWKQEQAAKKKILDTGRYF